MEKQRNIGLDIARICAMVLVWVNHSGFFALGMDPGLMEYGGVACIEVFFVLSGFLVGRSMLKAITASKPGEMLKGFYVNRILRILPLYYLMLLGLGVLSGQRPPVVSFVFLQSFSEEALNFLPPSWSLPIEAWFYFLIPPLLLGCYRVFSRKLEQKRAVYLAVAVLCVFFFLLRVGHVLMHDPDWDVGVRKQVLVRLDSPMLGVLLAAMKLYAPERYQRLGKSWLTPVFSVAGFLLLYFWFVTDLRECLDDSDVGRIFLFTLLPICSCLLVAYLENAAWPQKFRGNLIGKAICCLSGLSYSSYLLHFSIFQWISEYFYGARFVVCWAGFGLAIGVTLALSWLSWRFIEEPVARLKDRILVRL